MSDTSSSSSTRPVSSVLRTVTLDTLGILERTSSRRVCWRNASEITTSSPLADKVAALARLEALKISRNAVAIEVLIFDRDGELVGRDDG